LDSQAVDEHIKAAARLASHWKQEAEHQAALAQAIGGAEFQRELRQLKVEAASERRVRLETEVRYQALEVELLKAQHALERAEARAEAAEENARGRFFCTAEAETQTESPSVPTVNVSCGSEQEGVQEDEGLAALCAAYTSGSPTEGVTGTPEVEVLGTPQCEGGASGGGLKQSNSVEGVEMASQEAGHSASGNPSQMCDAPMDVDEQEDDEEEEEIIVLEICLNGEEESAVGSVAGAMTPCSVRRRRVDEMDTVALSNPAHTPTGPIRVVFTGLPTRSEGCPAPRSLEGAMEGTHRVLDLGELVSDAEAVLKETEAVVGGGDEAMQDPDAALVTASIAASPSVEDVMDWVPLQLLTDFKNSAGSRPGFVAYTHPASGLQFELGPAPDPEGFTMDSGSEEEEEIMFVPVRLGDTAAHLPEYLQEEITFPASGKTKLLCTLMDVLAVFHPPRHKRATA
jgi:hypothetical protein